jgi:hypothetical protein
MENEFSKKKQSQTKTLFEDNLTKSIKEFIHLTTDFKNNNKFRINLMATYSLLNVINQIERNIFPSDSDI